MGTVARECGRAEETAHTLRCWDKRKRGCSALFFVNCFRQMVVMVVPLLRQVRLPVNPFSFTHTHPQTLCVANVPSWGGLHSPVGITVFSLRSRSLRGTYPPLRAFLVVLESRACGCLRWQWRSTCACGILHLRECDGAHKCVWGESDSVDALPLLLPFFCYSVEGSFWSTHSPAQTRIAGAGGWEEAGWRGRGRGDDATTRTTAFVGGPSYSLA